MSGVSADGMSRNGTEGLFSAMLTEVRTVEHTRPLAVGVAWVNAGRKDETKAIVMEVCVASEIVRRRGAMGLW